MKFSESKEQVMFVNNLRTSYSKELFSLLRQGVAIFSFEEVDSLVKSFLHSNDEEE